MTSAVLRTHTIGTRFSRMIVPSTRPDSVRFSALAKVPLAIAPKPPPMLIRPTLISVRPISSTTMPVTSGVIRRFTNGRMRDTPISTNDPAITTPKIAAITVSTGVPCLTIRLPPAISGPTKLKLVPGRSAGRRPAAEALALDEGGDAGNHQRHRHDQGRIAADTPSAWQISRPGVTIGTMIASRCCSAATKATIGAGRSFGP